MTLNEYLAAEGLTAEEIAAIIGNEKQAKAMTKALGLAEEGRSAKAAADAEKDETAKFWEQKTQELQGSVNKLTAAEKRAATAEAKAAERTAYLKSLADQGYDVPKEMYDGTAPEPAKPVYMTREDLDKAARATAPDLITLTAISNQYRNLMGDDYLAIEDDFKEAQKAGKPLRDYVAAKYNFEGKRTEKAQKADQDRIDKIVAEQLKTKEAELVAKYGSNSNLSTPLPTKFDKLVKTPGFKEDSWKSAEGRRNNRNERLKKFENVTLQ